MTFCMVPGCSSNLAADDSAVEFFLFPKSLDMCQVWVEAFHLVNAEINLDEDVVCSLHFDDDCFFYESQDDEVLFFTKKLKENAVPTRNLPNVSGAEDKIVIVKHELQNVNCAEYNQNIILPSNVQIQNNHINSVTELVNQNKYAMIKNRQQLSDMKDANARLQKQIADIEKDLAKQTKAYGEKLREQIEVRNKLKKYARNTFSEQRTKAILSKVFSPTQIKVLLGRKKTYWSDHDMAVAYTIRHLSNISCYNYLMRNMNIPLPGLSSIKRWINVKNLGNKNSTNNMNQPDGDTSNVQNLEEDNLKSEEYSVSNYEFSQENDVFMLESLEEIDDSLIITS